MISPSLPWASLRATQSVIIEMLANVNLGKDLEVLAQGGIVAVVGSRGSVEVNPRELMSREAAVVGVMGGTTEELAQGFAYINAGLISRALRPVVGKQFALESAVDAHYEVLEHNGGAFGKIVLLPWTNA